MTLDEQRIDATAREAISGSLPGLPLSDDPNVHVLGVRLAGIGLKTGAF
jgi:hypothetical protein